MTNTFPGQVGPEPAHGSCEDQPHVAKRDRHLWTKASATEDIKTQLAVAEDARGRSGLPRDRAVSQEKAERSARSSPPASIRLAHAVRSAWTPSWDSTPTP